MLVSPCILLQGSEFYLNRLVHRNPSRSSGFGLSDIDCLLIEIHVLPFQTQDFCLSHSRLQQYDDDQTGLGASSDENCETENEFSFWSLKIQRNKRNDRRNTLVLNAADSEYFAFGDIP